jgi:rare lipoprotein A
MKKIVVALLCAGLAACASAPRPSSPTVAAPVVQAPAPVASVHDCSWYRPAEEDISKRGDYVAGGLYRPSEKDRTPSSIPDISCIPEPQVVALPRSKVGNNPVYRVLDKEYRVLADTHGFAEEGLASYYGEKFHGRLTSNREVYDMYAFSAAHKTLPIPSFARVTNLDTGKSVVVRVNDRGPFHDGRVMDLSLAAAVKLGVYPAGTGRVRVEALQPGDTSTGTTFAAAPASTPLDAATRHYRYPMRSADGQANAQGFDDWMKQRGVRVATGRPALLASNDARPPSVPLPAVAAAAPVAAPADAALAAVAPMQAAPADAITVSPLPPPPAGDAITLQVASFSTRDNADRALATLRSAGIQGGQLLDAVANGLPIWRLRVGPVPAVAEAELGARLRGLGFATPQRVHN